MTAAPPDAFCALHAGVAAAVVCGRCGGFACAGCRYSLPEEELCAACAKRVRSGLAASPRARLALVLGIVGLHTAFVAGIVGLAFANLELADIDRGRAPEAGRAMARGARVLGLINLCLFVGALLVLGARCAGEGG